MYVHWFRVSVLIVVWQQVQAKTISAVLVPWMILHTSWVKWIFVARHFHTKRLCAWRHLCSLVVGSSSTCREAMAIVPVTLLADWRLSDDKFVPLGHNSCSFPCACRCPSGLRCVIDIAMAAMIGVVLQVTWSKRKMLRACGEESTWRTRATH